MSEMQRFCRSLSTRVSLLPYFSPPTSLTESSTERSRGRSYRLVLSTEETSWVRSSPSNTRHCVKALETTENHIPSSFLLPHEYAPCFIVHFCAADTSNSQLLANFHTLQFTLSFTDCYICKAWEQRGIIINAFMSFEFFIFNQGL